MKLNIQNLLQTGDLLFPPLQSGRVELKMEVT